MTNNEFSIHYLFDKSIMYLAESGTYSPSQNKNMELQPKDLCLFRVDEICAEDETPRKEALENVLSAMRIDGINFIYLVIGNKNGVSFYYGASKDMSSEAETMLSINDIGEYILKRSLQGNFRGSKISTVSPDQKRVIIDTIGNMKNCAALEGVPGANKNDEKFQAIDRLVDCMLGDEFVFMVAAKPLNRTEMLKIQEDTYSLYSKLLPMSKMSIQNSESTNSGKSVSVGENESKSTNSGKSSADTRGTNESKSTNEGTNKSTSRSNSKTESSQSSSSSSGHTTQSSGSEGSSRGSSISTGTNNSTTTTESQGSSISNGTSHQETTNTGTGTSKSVSREFIERSIQDWIKYLDDVLLPRIDYGKGKGAFISSISVLTNNQASLQKLQNTAVALYAGEIGNRLPLTPVELKPNAKAAIRSFQLARCKVNNISSDDERLAHCAMSQIIEEDKSAYLGNWITTNELGVIAGLPQKEVVGMRLRKEVEFGLNPIFDISDENKIELGNLVQSGNELKNNIVYMDKNVLDQHVFITGVTGSGKTTTCQKLLHSADTPFLVIEPAKTEYRILKEEFDDLIVFTLGKNDVAPFKMNPFVFFKHENITSRVDMIKACIEAAFDMEAAIPQIIESAIYRSYEDYGWNISNNTNSRFEDPFAPGTPAFPTLSDLIRNTTIIVNEQGFDDRLKNDYIGSIKARLQGLIVGSKGLMLNTPHSVDFESLLDHNVVLELEEIRSGSEKSLIMGFVLINLMEAIKAKYLKNGTFRHITLVEEAHRLLSKFQPGDAPSKRHGVEMFADMLAEIRKYGESLIIVDQIPNKLTSEVLKNTNTKIIHRIFAEDDKDAIGNTVMLDKEQKEFLSNLGAGRAVFFSAGMQKAVQIQVKMSSDTTRQAPKDELLVDNAMEYYSNTYQTGALCGTELFEKKPTKQQVSELHKLDSSKCIQNIFSSIKIHLQPLDIFIHEVKKAEKALGRDIIEKYIAKYIFRNCIISSDKEEEAKVISEIMDIILSDGTFNAEQLKYYSNCLNPSKA